MKTALAVTAWLALTGNALAQAAPRVLFGIEAQRDRFTYHFTNPSSFDTPGLVPHFFEQRYVADNVWALAALRYLARIAWETTAGLTPWRSTTGDDYDTFFQPDGTVVVSGTTGGIRIRSFQFSQRAEVGRIRATRLATGYRFRFDQADFGVGHKTVTLARQPAAARDTRLVEASEVTTRERTRSQTHEIYVAARASSTRGSWRIWIDGELSPTTLGRLLVQLPDKYPGRDLVFIAKVLAGAARFSVARSGRWPIEIAIDSGRTWSYRSTDRLSRRSAGVRFSLGLP